MSFWTSDMTGQVLTILIPILVTAVGGVLTVLGGRLTVYIGEKYNTHKFDKYFNILNDTIQSVVTGLNQTTVNVIKAAAEDGKLTDEEKTQIFESAKSDIYAVLGPKGIQALQLVYADVEKLISCKIETAVLNEAQMETNKVEAKKTTPVTGFTTGSQEGEQHE